MTKCNVEGDCINKDACQRQETCIVPGPQFQHVCEFCTFLGPYKYNEVEHDLYFCDKRPGEVPALFARYGNDPSDYHATPNLNGYGGDLHPALWQARRQARLRGLLK